MAPLRNSKAVPKVADSVAQLLSLPFVLNEPLNVVEVIKMVGSSIFLLCFLRLLKPYYRFVYRFMSMLNWCLI